MPALAASRSWISASGSASGRVLVELHQDQLRHREAELPRQLAGHQLGHERLGTLSGAAQLDDVEAVVVGLYQRGQRAALAQRRDVADAGESFHPGRAESLEVEWWRVHREAQHGEGAGPSEALTMALRDLYAYASLLAAVHH